MKVKIELEESNKIIAEITYNKLHKKNMLFQWIKTFNTIWKFDFIETKERVYYKKTK